MYNLIFNYYVKLNYTSIKYKHYINVIGLLKKIFIHEKQLFPTKGMFFKKSRHNFKLKSTVNKSFSSYIFLCIFSQKLSLKIHHSFLSFFVKNSRKDSINILSINKLYSKYSNSIIFIYNIFFYKLKTLLFGNLFFKHEVNSLNWLDLSYSKSVLNLPKLL